MKRNPIPMIAAGLLLSLSLTAQAPQNSPPDSSRYDLLLKSGSFIPERNISTDKIALFNRKAVRTQGKTFAIIQFDHIPAPAEKEQLQRAGIDLLEYIPNNAYTVTISGGVNSSLLTQFKIRSIIQLTPQQKMEPALAKGNFPGWAVQVAGTVDVWISFPRTFSYETVIRELQEKNFDIVSTLYKNYRVLAIRVAVQRLGELASQSFIEYVEPAPHQEQALNNKSIAVTRANVLGTSLPGGRNLKGQGVVIGVGDDSDPMRHVDFTGRLINRASVIGGSHGVHVEGIVGGAGIIQERLTGAAPKSTIIAQTYSNIIVNSSAYVQDYGMVITNNSYGNIVDECSSFGLYTLYSRILDQQAFELPQLQHVFAAGNSGLFGCSPYPDSFATVLGDFQSAKNVISVGNTLVTGAIRVNSSRGPVRDGRLKPEITADGSSIISTFPTNTYGSNSGTSMSSPAIAGGLVLLYERYRQLNSGANPKNGLMKALICNGGTDLGSKGPDYTFGFGWVDLLRSVKMLENNNYFDDSVANGISNVHTITVPANTAQLKVMLYWNDPAASVLASHTLVNDLDLKVADAVPDTTFPQILDTIPLHVKNLATTGADHINNIEQVVIDNPVAGTYKLVVKGTAVTQNPKQEYFLVYDTIPVSTTLTYPIGNEHLKPDDSLYISWDSFGNNGNTFTIEYSNNDGASWSTVASGIDTSLRLLKWFVPNTTPTDQARIKITHDGTGIVSMSERFTILEVPTVTLASNQCEGYINLDWTATPVAGATDYEVMKLQGDEMVSVGTTSGTTYTIPGLSKDSIYWVSVRARMNGNPGRRANAISVQPNSGACTGNISDNDIKMDAIISPASSGRIATSTELSNNITLTVRVRNLDNVSSTAALTFSYSINGGSTITDPPVSPTILAGGTYDYSFASPLNLSAAGSYTIQVNVATGSDPVPANNSISKNFKQLANSPISLAVSFLDDIETATAQSTTNACMGFQGLDRYDFVNNTVFGRASTFVNTGISYSGSKAFTLDVDRYTPGGNTDSLTGTFNLGSYNAAADDIRFNFRYKNHGQSPDLANKVWIRGDDQKTWIPVYDLYANQNSADGTFKLIPGIELSDSLVAHTQNFSSSFQIRWGQWGQLITADNDGGAGYTFDDILLYKVTDDIQLLSIDSPIVSSCGLSNSTPVIITVRNSSNSTTATAVPVQYRIDGSGSWIAGSIPPIAANTTVQYSFPVHADLSATGPHLLEVQLLYPSDTYIDNDTLSVSLINSPVIASFPYLQNFEMNSGNWYTSGKNDSWEYGTPVSDKINRAASGSKAWKTRTLGNYNDLEKSYLYSPCFDIHTMTNPMLSLNIALDLEDCGGSLCDGAYVEYSADGVNWSRLGASGQGTNWYNKGYSGNNLWSVQDYTRWHVASIPLPTGISQLRLRFVVRSDMAVNRNGIAIDDIHIFDKTNAIYDGATMGSPVTQTINGGTNWIDFISGGKLVASLQPNNQSMGSTDVQAYINTGGVRNNNGQYYHDRNITIKPGTTALSDSASVRFYFLDTETESLINATGCPGCIKPSMACELGVSKYSDATDAYENGTVADDLQGNWLTISPDNSVKVPYDKGYYTEFKVKDFSEFWLSTGTFNLPTVLPLRLISFTAKKKSNKDVLAEWETASEYNVDHFELELAKGNTAYQQNRFVKIGEVQSHGNLSGQYEFTDAENNKAGVRYYRLKIVDNNGSFSYSMIRPVVFSDDITWQVYPNPSKGMFNLIYQLNEGETMTVNIYDVSGRIVKQYNPRANGFVQKLNIDLQDAGFAAGLYLVDVKGGEKEQQFKLIKQ